MPCDARVADGAIRGGFVGLLWAGFYGRSEFAASATATTAVLPFAARYTAVSVLSFSAFFGAYSGLLCGAERVFGAESHYSSLIAGGAMGGVIERAYRHVADKRGNDWHDDRVDQRSDVLHAESWEAVINVFKSKHCRHTSRTTRPPMICPARAHCIPRPVPTRPLLPHTKLHPYPLSVVRA